VQAGRSYESLAEGGLRVDQLVALVWPQDGNHLYVGVIALVLAPLAWWKAERLPGRTVLAITAVLAVLLAPRAWLTFRRLQAASPEDRTRLRHRMYALAMVTQWTLTAILIAHWIWLDRPWLGLGVVPALTWGALGITLGLALMIVILVTQWRRAGNREPALERARERMKHVEALLPHTLAERRMFFALSITAGICEELLFRGFMIWYLQNWIGLIQAALLSSVLFGLGHAYQGVRGIAQTTLVGAFMACVFLLSGSIWLCMLIHALMDLYAGFVGYALVSREATPEAA
jgi:membrane protease YdiL (CAAX protease family)